MGVGPEAMENAEERRKSFRSTTPIRSWSDIRGAFVAEGRFIDFQNRFVFIETRDGKEVQIRLDRLSDPDQVYVCELWGMPVVCLTSKDPVAPREFSESTVAWKASALCHKPLYFEDVQLERYGHEYGPILQPVVSTAHFFGNIVVLPYKMGIHPPQECQYALGYYRTGSCAPWTLGPVPLSVRGAIAEAAVIGGGIAILP
jgi:hypothetical protein